MYFSKKDTLFLTRHCMIWVEQFLFQFNPILMFVSNRSILKRLFLIKDFVKKLYLIKIAHSAQLLSQKVHDA